MFYLLNKPFDFTAFSFQTKRNISFTMGVFVTFFLWLFDNEAKQSLFAFADNGVIVSISQFLFLFCFHNFFVKKKTNGTVKLWQYMAGITAGVWLCFSLMYLYVTPVYFKTSYSAAAYILYIKDNLHFLFPFILFAVGLDSFFVLKTRLKQQQNTLQETAKEIEEEEITAATKDFVLHIESGQPIFSVCKDNLLFIKSADNYIEISFLQNEKPVKQLIRYQLSAIESNRENNFLYRVHRSYLCNLQNVAGISGGLQNCTLYFKNSALSVPVARSKAKEIMKLLQH